MIYGGELRVIRRDVGTGALTVSIPCNVLPFNLRAYAEHYTQEAKVSLGKTSTPWKWIEAAINAKQHKHKAFLVEKMSPMLLKQNRSQLFLAQNITSFKRPPKSNGAIFSKPPLWSAHWF